MRVSILWVAQSPPQFKDEVVKAIEKFFKTYIKEIKNLSVKDRPILNKGSTLENA